MRYVNTKATKRMESYRVRHGPQQGQPCLLLPLSFGVSSVSLLHLLDTQLRGQTERMNRTGYRLHVAHIDMSGVEPSLANPENHLEALQQRYPDHRYTCVPLADIFRPKYATCISYLQDFCQDDESLARLSNQDKLNRLLAILPSATSRSDIISFIRTELLTDIAKTNACESIIWGHSTTTLAEKTLAETAKGRGFSLPWQVSDGPVLAGLAFNYPLRDLLKKELLAYSALTEPPLTPFIIAQPPPARVSASAKNTTIDDLLADYFSTVEDTFPSIVANVVRTSGKLKALPKDEAGQRCGLCRMPTAADSFGLHGWGGDQELTSQNKAADGATVQLDSTLCYGCARATLNLSLDCQIRPSA